jgi:gliding motility-associated-like protein
LVIADRDCYSFSLNDSLCEGESVVLESDASLQVELSEQFEFNGGYKQKLLFTDVNCPQISFEEAVTIFNCKECRYAIPNIFSPNRDGVNDIFSISVNCPLAQFEAEIYDRWGSLLYRSKDPNRIWNGTGAQSGTYVYRIRMQLFNGRSVESIIETGTITLVM